MTDHRLYCARGTALPQAVLTDADVRRIRSEFVPYCRRNGARALSRRYSVHVNTIWKVTSYESWAHIA